VCGNSLLSVQKDLFNYTLYQELEKKKPQYFGTTSPKNKAILRQEIDGLIDQLTDGNQTFDFEVYFSEVFSARKGFNIIIANPPYGAKISKEIQRKFRINYGFVKFKIDSFALFIIIAMHISRNEGDINYIIPNAILNNYFLSDLRNNLIRDYQILELINFQKSVFEAVVHSLILHLKKCTPEKTHRIKLKKGILELYDEVPQEYYLDIPGQSFIFLSSSERTLLKIISQNSVQLQSVIELRQAIKTGNDKKYISKSKSSDSYKPILRGRDVSRYAFNDPKLYVNYGKHLACPRDHKIFEQDHVLIRETAKKIIATLDRDNFYIMSSLYCGILINKTYDLQFILGLLNSTLFHYLMFKINFENTSGAFTKAKIYHYDQLPVKVGGDEAKQNISRLVQFILLGFKLLVQQHY